MSDLDTRESFQTWNHHPYSTKRVRGLPFRQQKHRCSSRHHTCQLSLDRYQINQSHSRPVFFRSAKQ